MSNALDKIRPGLRLQRTPARGTDLHLAAGAVRVLVIKSKCTLITWPVEEEAQRERYNSTEQAHEAIRPVTQVNPNFFDRGLKRTFRKNELR